MATSLLSINHQQYIGNFCHDFLEIFNDILLSCKYREGELFQDGTYSQTTVSLIYILANANPEGVDKLIRYIV